MENGTINEVFTNSEAVKIMSIPLSPNQQEVVCLASREFWRIFDMDWLQGSLQGARACTGGMECIFNKVAGKFTEWSILGLV